MILPTEHRTYDVYRVYYYADGEICAIINTYTRKWVIEPDSMFFPDEKEALLCQLV